MKFLFLSLFIHICFFAYGQFKLEQSSIALKPNVESTASVMHISIKLEESDVQELKEKISKIKKNLKKTKKNKVKKVQNKNNNKLAISKAKRSSVEGKEVLNQYIAEIRSFVERKKFYPKKARRMRQAGAVEICLEVDSDGNFHDIHIKKASAHKTLNKAALALITEISKYKPFPKEMGEKITLSIPLTYALND